MQIPPGINKNSSWTKICSSAIFLQPYPIKIAIKPKSGQHSLSPVGALSWGDISDCSMQFFLTSPNKPFSAWRRVAQLTLEDVRFGCEVESNGQRHHQDGEEQQCLQGWNQGTFVPAKDPCKNSWISQSKTASSLFGSNGTDRACGAFPWQPLLCFGIKAAEGRFLFTLTSV